MVYSLVINNETSFIIICSPFSTNNRFYDFLIADLFISNWLLKYSRSAFLFIGFSLLLYILYVFLLLSVGLVIFSLNNF